jgi:hypothetical protein
VGTNSKHVSFAATNDSTPNQDVTKNFEFYKKNFCDQVPSGIWNKFTKKPCKVIYDIRKKNNEGGEATVQKGNRNVSSVSSFTNDTSPPPGDTVPALAESLKQLSTTDSVLPSSVVSLDDGEESLVGIQLGGQAAAKWYKVLVVMTSGNRIVAKVNAIPSKLPPVLYYRSVELDTHADTCVAGKNFIVLSFTGRECDVYPYSQQYEVVQNIPIVLAATAVQHPDMGETFILLFNEVLWYGIRWIIV